MTNDAPVCPYCQRVMTYREKDEQGCCNDCHDNATWPDGNPNADY